MALTLLSGMLVVMTLVGVPVARADGIGSDADVHVAQSLGGRELTVTIRRVGPVLGPLHVDVVTHRGDAPGDESVARYGPEIDFTYSFAMPGRYKVWVQTERDYAILTAPTEVEVPQP